jgi:UDP-glucuronate decarboxylase
MHPNDGRVVSNFIVQALKGEPITIYGDGKQTRSFQYIDDLLDGMIKTMDTSDDFIGPINIGNPNEFSMLELANEIIDLTGSKSKIEYRPLPADDPIQRRPDISMAITVLNWKPKIQLREGLTKTINYFDKLLKTNDKII